MNETNQSAVAAELLSLTKSQLMLKFRFLAVALNHLKVEEDPEVMFATDGKVLRYAPQAVVSFYKNERTYLNRLYMHTLFHCMLQHMYAKQSRQGADWNLACDIAVEHMILSLKMHQLNSFRDGGIRATLEKLEQQLPAITAEIVYDYLKKGDMSEADKEALHTIFAVDDHAGWLQGPGQAQDSDSEHRETQDLENEQQRESWDAIAKRALVDLENFEQQNQHTEALVQNLKVLMRRKYDYQSFLEQLFTRREEMHLNMDEFDQVFYTYGLKLYNGDKKLCLIEPLEQQEQKKIRDIAIIIDTSYSVSGDQVVRFVQKTYDILNQSQYFFRTYNLHLIQCDNEVREDVKITSAEELERYLATMEIKGLGGTDFRPGLTYVQELVEQHEFEDLKGVLYFTDGEGIFPKKRPPFETAFIFVDDHMTEPLVPPWALSCVFPTDEPDEKK